MIRRPGRFFFLFDLEIIYKFVMRISWLFYMIIIIIINIIIFVVMIVIMIIFKDTVIFETSSSLLGYKKSLQKFIFFLY
jgi:hypothetical protein